MRIKYEANEVWTNLTKAVPSLKNLGRDKKHECLVIISNALWDAQEEGRNGLKTDDLDKELAGTGIW